VSKKGKDRLKAARAAAKRITSNAGRVLLEQGQSAQREYLNDAASELIEANKPRKLPGANPGYMLGKRRQRLGAPPPRCETCNALRELKLWCRIGSKRAVTLRTLAFCTEYCRDAWRAANPERPIWHQRKTGSIKGGDRTRPKLIAKRKAPRSEIGAR
jgi:hypothetical protein